MARRCRDVDPPPPIFSPHARNPPVDDEAGGAAVQDVDGGCAQPRLQLVDGEGYVLRVPAVEHPDLSINRGPGHTVTVVVEQHALLLGGAAA